MEPFTLILAALLAQTTADSAPPPPPPSQAMLQADADADGIVTRAEALTQADLRFAQMDADHDGKVTPQERRTAMAAMRGGEGRPPMRGDGPRRDRGPGGGGDMTLAEARTRAGERFDRLDANHDGRLDRTELDAARTRMGDRPPPPPAE